jgi:hypothetical protein
VASPRQSKIAQTLCDVLSGPRPPIRRSSDRGPLNHGSATVFGYPPAGKGARSEICAYGIPAKCCGQLWWPGIIHSMPNFKLNTSYLCQKESQRYQRLYQQFRRVRGQWMRWKMSWALPMRFFAAGGPKVYVRRQSGIVGNSPGRLAFQARSSAHFDP